MGVFFSNELQPHQSQSSCSALSYTNTHTHAHTLTHTQTHTQTHTHTHTHTERERRLREIGPLNVNAFQQICFASRDIGDKTRAQFNEMVKPVN